MNPLAWCYKVTPRLDYEPCVNSGTDPMSLPSPTIITPFMIATMNPLAWCCNVTRLGHRAEGSTMGELATMAVPTTNTKRRTVHCSKHAFAPIASFRPKNAVAPNVTLPVQRHQTCLRRAGLASESLVTGDDPLNATDPLGLAKGGPQNKLSKEFEGYSDAALNKLYKSLKGRLSAADKALKLRVAAEQKARKLRGSTGGGGPIKFVTVAPSAELGPNQSPHLVPITSLQSPPDPTGPALQAPASPGFGSLLPLLFLFVARAGAGTACGLAASETGPGAAAAFAACAGAA